jgi:putative cardiolipin synthase
LKLCLGEPKTDLKLVSAYFVPTAEGVSWLVDLTRSGVRVSVLTNSLEATDVALVHAGYAKRRRTLLEAGVALYELRRTAPPAERARQGGRMGSSGSSLHAKTFAVDRERVFIGSFNFDPRSAQWNTEMGFVIDSPAMAQRIDTVFRTDVPTAAYEVRLSESGRLCWIERREGQLVRHDREPGTTMWKRAAIRLLSMLPIERLL